MQLVSGTEGDGVPSDLFDAVAGDRLATTPYRPERSSQRYVRHQLVTTA